MKDDALSHGRCLSPSHLRVSVSPDGDIAGRAVRLLLLGLMVCAVWLTIEDRWGANFQFPVRYMADSHYILGMMKLAEDGDLGLFTHITTKSLGAPFIGQLNDFPEAERAIVWLGGQIARVIGLMPAANAIVMLSCLVAAFSFYAAARLWKIPRLPAWVFAIVYAFLPQSLRSLDHLGVGFTGLLPLQLYCFWYIASVERVSWNSPRLRLTLVISLLSGLLNIYWVYLSLHIYSLALLYRLLKRRKASLVSFLPLVITSLVAGSFLASFIVYRDHYGANPAALVRSYFDVEKSALKPIDLLLPSWGAYWSVSSGLFKRYYEEAMVIGEWWWGAYIGLCSLFGLAFLFVKGIKRQLNNRAPSLPCCIVVWLILYTGLGGVHATISLFLNFYDIRGTNRYSEAIATIGLLYFVFIISKSMRKWPLGVKIVCLALVSSLAIFEQSFKTYTFTDRHDFSLKERVTADRDLVSKLEARLEAGSMIYILPAMSFPEPFHGRAPYKLFSLYDPIRPFLYSTTLRYSYGSNKGRMGADWQLDVQELPAREMAAVLESYGFSGILLDRDVYDDRGEQLLGEFAQAGWPIGFEQGINNEWAFIPLRPALNPTLPTQTPYALSATK